MSKPPLTPRQVEILQLIADGCTYREIAQQLSIAISTARNHVHYLLGRLGAVSSSHAVAMALRKGLIK